MPQSFSVIYRNIGHWDIYVRDRRAFRIRGGPGYWNVFDERETADQKETPYFRSQEAAMSYICAELMHELIVAEGQTPVMIEGWNIPRHG